MTAVPLFDADETTVPPPSSLDFEAFWQAWPADHRVGRKQAEQQWARLKAQDRAAALDDLAWRTANDRRWQGPAEDGRWAIPHPFRWIRDRRFEDARQAVKATTAAVPAVVRAKAVEMRRMWGMCRHETACESYAECVDRIAARLTGGGQ